MMQDEYDFSNAKRGKFFIPQEETQVPIYLDKDILNFFKKQVKNSDNLSIQELINKLLRKDIEIIESMK